MAIYTVHLPPDAVTSDEVAETSAFVKEGFSTRGFFFTVLWLLSQRLWLFALGYAVIFALVIAGIKWFGLPPLAFGGIMTLLAILIGLEGNEWVRRRYTAKGWIHVGTVSGPSLDECERRFFLNWVMAREQASPGLPNTGTSAVIPQSRPQPVLGLFPTARNAPPIGSGG